MSGQRTAGKTDYHAKGVLYLPEESRFNYLLHLPEGKKRKPSMAALPCWRCGLRAFCAKWGGMFTFAGSQYRLEVDEQEYFIDLLLYRRGLRDPGGTALDMRQS